MSDRFDDIFDDNNESSDGNNQNNTQNVKPVKLSRKAVTGILVVCVIIIMILLLTIRGCSIEKLENDSESENLNNTSSVNRQENIKNTTSSVDNNSEKSAVYSEVSSTSSEISNSSKIEQSSYIDDVSVIDNISNQESGGDVDFTQVNEPLLSELIKTNGIVISKKVYVYNKSYIYGVVLSVIVGDGARNVEYFCPRNTYDALHSGEALKITYQYDTNGIVSIATISK